MKLCEDCGSKDYPYHEEYCTKGETANWSDSKDDYWEKTEKKLKKEREELGFGLVREEERFRADKAAHDKAMEDQHAEDVHYYLNKLQAIKDRFKEIFGKHKIDEALIERIFSDVASSNTKQEVQDA